VTWHEVAIRLVSTEDTMRIFRPPWKNHAVRSSTPVQISAATRRTHLSPSPGVSLPSTPHLEVSSKPDASGARWRCVINESHIALLRALHDEHAAPLLRYTQRLTGDDQFAQDVVQETLLRASKKNPEILQQGVTASRAWLYTVAREVAGERRGTRAGEPPSDTTESALDSWLVADALTQLTPDHRTVIIRAYYMGQSVAELAAELDVPPGTVRSRLHYGLRALRLALQERGVTGQ
jgi:RNA polymerase sigma-70 factor, ECF subfamily